MYRGNWLLTSADGLDVDGLSAVFIFADVLLTRIRIYYFEELVFKWVVKD